MREARLAKAAAPKAAHTEVAALEEREAEAEATAAPGRVALGETTAEEATEA